MIGFSSNSLDRRKVFLRREMTSFCPHYWSTMFIQYSPRDGGVRICRPTPLLHAYLRVSLDEQLRLKLSIS